MSTRCPRCPTALFDAGVDGVTLLGCGRCGGIWLDNRGCRQVMQGAAPALVELAEHAGRHATVQPDVGADARCPVCSQALARGEVPGAAVPIHTCPAHGTWFDRNGLRLVALHFANLPAPLQFRREDYQLPATPPESLGDWVLQQALGAPTRPEGDAIPYVQDVRAGGSFLTPDALVILLAIAIVGALLSAAMHVASLLGRTVTSGPLHLATVLVVFVPFGLGIWANYQMGNAVKTSAGSFGMGTRHLLRGLRPIEWVVFMVAEVYVALAMRYFWPAGTSEIHIPGSDLTVANARAVWICDLAFYVAAVAIVLTALRLARRGVVEE